MRVFLTKRAEKNYLSIKKYILSKFGYKTAEAYKQKVNSFLNVLEKFPEIGTIEIKDKEIRGFQLTKQTRVFYRIKKEKIIILAFFDVRQNPKKKPK